MRITAVIGWARTASAGSCRPTPIESVRAFRRGDLSLKWYLDGMRTTIDKAGRLVIPAAIRERAGLTAGTELEITVDEFGVRLERIAPGPRLVRVGRRMVARPTAAS